MSALTFGVVFLCVLVLLLGLGLVAGVFYVVWKILRGVFFLVGRALGLVKNTAVDALHTVGALVTAAATVPLALVNTAILRLGSARHYARAFADEMKGAGVGLWRVALGNPLRFVGLGALVDRVERRLPDGLARAARPRRARRATFDGYEVVGTLPSGGSGAQLFVARPKAATHKRFLRAGRLLPSEVVIKSFALEAGSTLPQIVRESRALEAASALGLVCEHQLTNDHFFYVMPYVKGDDLERITRALHARATGEGLADAELRLAVGYAIDLCDSLQRFHSGGLWHKDVKPSNVIVAKGRAHLVDFGLVTPLASALTLTTHGTEYYRDPEMVRLAMQGVKVHEVDGVRFDVYSAGAVLYSLIENSFPAHGSLSRLSKRAPEALRWVVQRAMAEMGSRYASAGEMRADLAALADARDPFALRPADLPSFRSQPARSEPAPAAAAPSPFAARPAEFERASFEPAATRAEPAAFAPSLEPPRRRRRHGPALALAAAGLFGMFVLGGGALLFAARSRGHAFAEHANARRASRIELSRHDGLEEPAWSSLSEREREVVDLARGVAGDLGADEAERAQSDEARAILGERSTDAEAAEQASAEASPAPLSGIELPERGRVLVLDDLTTDVDARAVSLLRARLAERGFTIEGSAEAQGGVELLAGARHAVGLGRADEPDTQKSVQAFLDGSDALDALILVSRAEERGEHLYRVFVRRAGAAR